MGRSIFTEGKFLVYKSYKSQDALRRQWPKTDLDPESTVTKSTSGWFTKTQGEVCGGSTDDDDGVTEEEPRDAFSAVLSRGVYDCWRFGSRSISLHLCSSK